MKILRLIILIGFIGISMRLLGASPIQETQTPTSYTMKWNETGKNGGTVRGTFSGPMKDGKRNGRWTADVKFNLFGDEEFRTGSITMVRNYKDGVPDGAYTYNFDVNWRDGAYNSYQGKWIYGSPSGYKETVSGAFKMGRPDGAWTIKSDKKLGYECKMTFNDGIPVGKRVYHDGINGKDNEEFNEEGLLIGRYSDNGDGWRYKDASSISLEKRVSYNLQKFFHLETEDDYNYFAHAGELYSWLKSYPYGASDETIEYEAYMVKDKEDLDFLEFVGSPDYVEQSMVALARSRESKILEEICNELNHINNVYIQRIEDYERKAPKYRNEDFYSLYMTKCNRNLLDSLSPVLNRIEDMPLIKEVMAGKDGNLVDIIREHLNNFRKLNQENSTENIQNLEAHISRFLKNGRRVAEDLNIDSSIITDEEIEKYYDGQALSLSNMSFHLVHDGMNKNDLEKKIREIRYLMKQNKDLFNPDDYGDEIADLEAMDGYNVNSEGLNEWVGYINRKGVKIIKSPSDIKFRDFVLYVAPRSLDKPKKDSWPSENNLINAMNAVRRIIPERVSLTNISRDVTLYNSEGFGYGTRKQPLSELDENKLRKLWKEYAKHYGIPIEK